MNTLPNILVLTAATVGSFSVALLVQWLTLRALFIAMPGATPRRHKVSAAQSAVLHTRRLVMPARSLRDWPQGLKPQG